MTMLFMSIGILIGYVISTHLDYYLNPCLVIVLPIIYLMFTTLLPDTPQYLLRAGKVERAREAYNFYRNKKLALSCPNFESNVGPVTQDKQDFENLKNSIVTGDKDGNVELKDFGKSC